MAISPELAKKFEDFVGKTDVVSKLESELAKGDLSLEKLGINKAAALLPVLFELVGEIADVIPEDKRDGLVLPDINPGDELTEDLVGQMAEFVLAGSEVVDEKTMEELMTSSIAAVCEEMVRGYKERKV